VCGKAWTGPQRHPHRKAGAWNGRNGMERTMTDDEIDQLWRDFLDNDCRGRVRLPRRDLRNPQTDLADWFIITVVRDGKPMRCIARALQRTP
jgi:hypothetical protein